MLIYKLLIYFYNILRYQIVKHDKNIIPKTMIAHTQPRRVAAVSLAQRISDEVNSDLGEYVGY